MSDRKFWTINGTNEFSQVKASLKPIRKELNRKTGINETEKPSNEWPHHIEKGPEHPSLKPFFREITLNSLFWVPRGKKKVLFKKISATQGLETGQVLPTSFDSEDQFSLGFEAIV